MAYSGFLFKIGEYTFPHKYIKADTYKPYANMLDVDDWTDENGELHRNVLALKPIKVEFETPAMLTNKGLEEIMASIRANYIDEREKSCYLTAYISEFDEYVTQKAYFVDFAPQIYMIRNNILYYNPIRFAFVGGVADD